MSTPSQSSSKPLTLRFTDHPRPDVPEPPLTPGTLTLVEGATGTEAMRQRLIIDCAQNGRTVLHITSGNPIDSTGLARRAQAQGLDPAYVLHASLIARGFTAYQLSALLEERMPDLLSKDDSIAAVLVLDPLALYTDEDVRQEESMSLTQHAVDHLKDASREHACPIVIVQPRRPAWDPSPSRHGPASGPSRKHVADLLGLLQTVADEHIGVMRGDAGAVGAKGCVIELPQQERRVHVAETGFKQARLDRFALEVGGRG